MSDTGLEAELHAWLAARSDRVIETACAHVFLGPQSALKMKRHKDLGYVDFSTAERRLWALERELEFNRTAAPDIYRAVRRITREADGRLALERVLPAGADRLVLEVGNLPRGMYFVQVGATVRKVVLR